MASFFKWFGVALLALAIICVSGLLGPRLAGEFEVKTDLGQTVIKLDPSFQGGIEGYVPVADWGLRFEGPPVPFRIRAELRSVDRNALLRATNGDQNLVSSAEADLEAGARDAVLNALAWSLVIAVVLSVTIAFLWRSLQPRWLLPVGSIGLFLAATLVMAVVTRDSINRDSFDNPTFFASGAELQRILEVIDQTEVESPYGNEFENILRSIGAVLAVGVPEAPSSNEMYLGSDFHANPLVVRPVAKLVGDRPLMMVGDFGQRGSGAESALISPRVAAMGGRVLAVSGNHDSAQLMRKLAAKGVTVLDADGTLRPNGTFLPPPVIEVTGVKVAGWADPLEFGGEGDPLAERPVTAQGLDDPEGAIAGWVSEMLTWFDSLKQKPDVLMVHQQELAKLFAEAIHEAGYRQHLTIATGHTHEQMLEKIGTTVIVNPGTIGAGGAFDAGEAEIGLAHLRFADDGSLRSAELIGVEPFSGSARATRIVVDSLCPDEERCSAVIPDKMVTR